VTTLERALEYIARGWSVLPLAPGAKRPATKIENLLSGGARMSERDAHRWWSPDAGHAPGAMPGIGIVTGPPSGISVIDVDPRNGGTAADVRGVGCESRLVVQTGGGGYHFYCTLPPGCQARCGKTKLPGVDLKAAGGYVVAPPSVHPGGERYEWIDTGEMCELPAWALELSPSLPALEDKLGGLWVSRTFDDPASVAPGTQDDVLTRLAWYLSGHLADDVAEALLWQFARCLTLGNPADPWTISHVQAKLASAYAKRAANPSTIVEVVGRPAAPPAPAAQADVDAIVAAGVSAADFVVTKREDWIVENVAAPGCWTEIVGEVKKGKTTFNMQMIRCLLRGEPFLGWRTERTPVVLYTEQVGLSLEATLERAGIRSERDLVLLDHTKTFGRPWQAVVGALVKLCERSGARLLFVDTLTRLAGVAGEAENAAGVVSILDPFQAAKAAGIACVFVRHASKSRENREDVSRAGRGSTAITGDMDTALVLYQPGSEDVRRVRSVSRLGDEVELLLQYESGLYTVVATGATDVEVAHHDAGAARLTAHAEKRASAARVRVDQARLELGPGATSAEIARAADVDVKTAKKYLAERGAS